MKDDQLFSREKKRERILDERWPIIFTREKKRKRERKNFWMNDDQWWCYFYERKKRERERILDERWSMMGLFSGEKKEKERERERILDDHNDEIIFTREKKRERERNWSWTGDVDRLAEAFRKSNDRAPGDVMETRRENFSNHEIERFTLDWHVARFHPLPEENLDRYFLAIFSSSISTLSSNSTRLSSSHMRATIF